MTHITKERAQELLDGATTWRVCKPGCDGNCRTCIDNMGAAGALSLAAPDLARTVVAQADELARLRAVVAGSTTPPTDEDIAVHAAAGGFWQARLADGPLMHAGPRDAALLRWLRDDGALAQVWVLDATGRPCGWPTPAALASAGGAAPLDPVDALNAAVTAAILRAERLAREGADATAAYADVARYEAALAALHPADTVEGETAREGVALATGAAAVVRAAEGARR